MPPMVEHNIGFTIVRLSYRRDDSDVTEWPSNAFQRIFLRVDIEHVTVDLVAKLRWKAEEV